MIDVLVSVILFAILFAVLAPVRHVRSHRETALLKDPSPNECGIMTTGVGDRMRDTSSL